MAKEIKTNRRPKVKDISLPKEDIKVEKGQLTFLPALKKIIRKKK